MVWLHDDDEMNHLRTLTAMRHVEQQTAGPSRSPRSVWRGSARGKWLMHDDRCTND